MNKGGDPNCKQRNEAVRATNEQRVWEYLVTHPGATRKECAHALGLAARTVQDHITTLRSEWLRR
jgi:predicted ArsR family transcriptional regulator